MIERILGLPIVAKVLIAVAVALATGLLTKCAADELRKDNSNVERGVTAERLEGNEEVVKNVEKAKQATERPTLDQSERVRSKYERCRGEDCQ